MGESEEEDNEARDEPAEDEPEEDEDDGDEADPGAPAAGAPGPTEEPVNKTLEWALAIALTLALLAFLAFLVKMSRGFSVM